MITKTISRDVKFFYYEKLDLENIQEILSDALEFIQNKPKTKIGKFINGTDVLIDSVKLIIRNDKFSMIQIGINNNGVIIYFNLLHERYYYIQGGKILYVDDINDLNPLNLTD